MPMIKCGTFYFPPENEEKVDKWLMEFGPLCRAIHHTEYNDGSCILELYV